MAYFSVGNKLFQLSAMFDFEVTEALENRILDYLRHFYMSPLYRFSIIITLYCILSNKIYLHDIVPQISVTQHSKTDSVTKVLKRNSTSTVRLAACQSCSAHFIRRAISAVSRQELQRVLSNLSPIVKHTRVYKEVISNTHSNVT